MKPHKGLGKGLRALITETEVAIEAAGIAVSDVEIALIEPNPFQPRRDFDTDALEELRQSILQQGVLQPVLLRKAGQRYQLIVGERRWRASKSAGLTTIPAIVREVASDGEMMELALLENVQREDLNPIEVAKAILQLQNECGLTQETIAEKLGLSRAHVANTVRLLKLPDHIQAALMDGRLTMGHARALLSVEVERERDKLFEQFVADARLTVRVAEELTRRAGAKGHKQNGHAAVDRRQQAEIARLENRLQRALSTRVKIKPKGRGGIVEIQFHTHEDLERLLELLDR
jgi:ParB family chromosome partitioning protein